MKKRILSLILALSMVLSVFPLGAFAEGSTGELVMKNGLPDLTGLTPLQGGKYISNNWGYDSSTETLTLLSGTFDFSSTHPQTPNATGARPVPAVKCAIESYATTTITGGIFTGGSDGKVTNYGTISGGTFQNGCSVENYIYIENGTFYGSVKNYSYIENGTFEGTVTNDVTGYITGGTFQSTCSVTNTGIIKDGIFTIKVENGGIGEILGGIFAAGLSKKSGNVAGGVFNGKTGLDGVTGLHSITWDAASSKAKIVAVNDVSAVWDPYAYKDTTVTITADTEIYKPERQVHRRWQLQEQLRRQQKHREIHHAGRGRGAEPHG